MVSRGARTAIVAASAVVGVAVLVWQVRLVGAEAVRAGVAAVGWGFAGILAFSGLRFVARSVAWVSLMGGDVSHSSAVAAFISGDAIGNLTPFRLIASEPAKALLLGRGVDSSHALSALVVENVYYGISVAIVILIGAGAMLWAFDVSDAVRWAGWAVIGAMVLTLAVLTGLLWFKPAIASAALARTPFVRRDALAAKLRAFEETTYALVGSADGRDGHSGRNGRLATVVAAETAFHVFSFAETYLTLWLVTGVSSPLAAFVLDTVNRVINVVFLIVPLRVGVAETGSGLIASAIGLTRASGVSLALVAKGRVLVWAAVGLILILLRQKAKGRRQKSGQP
jgi:hypothetical protein